MVDIGFVERFPAIVSLETLKTTQGLEKMVVTQKGSRLSVQPVTRARVRHRRPPRPAHVIRLLLAAAIVLLFLSSWIFLPAHRTVRC